MALTDNIVSYWKLDESSGNAADSAGSNTLTNTNTATYAAALINNGGSFASASNQYLGIADASQTGLDFGTGAFSISMWMKPVALNVTYRIINKQDGTNGYGYCIIMLSDAKIRVSANSSAGAQDIPSTGTIGTTAAFTHVVFTRGATNGIRIYLNGSADTTTTNDARDVSSAEPFAIGARVDGLDSSYNGMVDEVGVWSRELTSAEVTSLYNGGSGLTYPFASGPANIKTWNGITAANIKTINGIPFADLV